MTDAPSGNDPWSSPSQNQPPPSYGSSPPGYGAPPSYGGPPARPASNGIGIAAMVVGIVSLFLWWIPLLGLVVAIVAVVLGILGIRKASKGEATNKGMAIAGLVTGILGLIASLFVTIFFFTAANNFGSLFECAANAQTIEEQEACNEQFEQDFGQ
jgi:CubicO group peptidase (beta-lactamase class C family)